MPSQVINDFGIRVPPTSARTNRPHSIPSPGNTQARSAGCDCGPPGVLSPTTIRVDHPQSSEIRHNFRDQIDRSRPQNYSRSIL